VRSFLGMPLTSLRDSAFRRPAKRRGRRFRARRTRRAVSDVVATILLLALTVTLFSAIFAFVTSFPSPPAQNSNQFQATLWDTPCAASTSGCAIGLNITHLAGPQVPGNALIFLRSAVNPTDCPFSGSVPVSLGITSPVWNLGQVWSEKFTSFPGCSGYTGDELPDNVTVYLISGSTLIFSVILPGQSLIAPPTITATWTNPASLPQGKAFQVLATISGTLGSKKAYVNLGGVPGESSTTQAMWFNSSSGDWQFNVTTGNTTSTPTGTYYGFINVTGIKGATTTAAVTVTIANGGATITLSPVSYSHTTGGVVTITGAGFVGSSVVSITYNGAVITPTACTSGTLSGNAITTTAAGGFVCTYTVAAGTIGVYPFSANDATSGQTAAAYFRLT
jgi:hypothetical protein